MLVFEGLVEGKLLRRYKRFLADVELANKEIITAHCPNTGAMTGCMPEGATVWLSRSEVKTRKYPHTWELVATEQGLVCIHSARANAVVKAGFAAGLVPGFEAYPQLQSEVKYGTGSRADLVLAGEPGQVFVEVKSVTLWRDGWGAFPDAVSDRALKHVQELAAICSSDTRAVLFFCVFHSGIERVCAAADIDPRYRQALAQAMDTGVEVMAWGCDISPQGIALARPLPFALDPG